MTRFALVGAVDFNEKVFRAEHYDVLIAVDAGYATLKSQGLATDLVIGDFDSLGYVPEAENILRFPHEKDESDMELAIAHACKAGADEIVLYGCLSRRLDHTLANIQVMRSCAQSGVRIFGVGCGFVLTLLAGPCCIAWEAFDPATLDAGEYGRYLSVFALGGPAQGVTEQGLLYSLENAVLPDTASLGLSNEFTGAPAEVSVQQGDVVVIFSEDAWPAVCLPQS